MSKKKDDEEVDQINHTFAFNESFTQASLTVRTDTPMTFEEYKQIIYDFIHDCDLEGKDLFIGDDGSTLLN